MATKLKGRPKAGTATAYEADFSAWLYEQAALIRSGHTAEMDAENVAEELEGMARSEFSKLVSALRVLLMHMLKWDHQPERRSRSWESSIREQRYRYDDLLEDNPSFRSRREKALERAYRSARNLAADEIDVPREEFPSSCPYDWDDILNRPFEADSAPAPK